MSIHQTVSDYTIRQWFPNTHQSQFLTAFRHLKKNSFTFHFQVFHPWSCETCSYYYLNERMWHFRGSKYTLTSPSYFQRVRPSNPRIYPAAWHTTNKWWKNLLHLMRCNGHFTLTQIFTWNVCTVFFACIIHSHANANVSCSRLLIFTL